MDSLPVYIPIIFIGTTVLTYVLFALAMTPPRFGAVSKVVVLAFIPLWALLHGWRASGGFYLNTVSVPPPFLLFGLFPGLLFLVLYFTFAPKAFVENNVSLRALTLVHIVRIPVEIGLYFLAAAKTIPDEMTFAGMNYDILSGIFSPIVFFLGFKGGKPRTWLLAIYNVAGLLLLVNVLIIAFLSFPMQGQKLAISQPNRAVLYFPYIWLPTIIVPIVLFSHLAALWKLVKGKTN